MKKLFLIGMVVIALCTVACGLAHRYTKPCTVWCRDGWDIIVEDNTGNLWQFEDQNNYYMYTKGDSVLITFDTNGTDKIEDDKIVRVALQ